ncbi:nucleotidyltransferase domain-containing protein [Candidatus Pacearchaeota archaeon]|nr:nucleotidyltransferase domain-containing protein [Candidatus Pacearchaeota archaeon]
MKKSIKGVKVEEFERAYRKTLAWFFAFPERKTGLTELSKLIKSSKTATKEAVETLINNEFINREIAGKAWILSANERNKHFQIKKIPYHLDKIYESGVIEVIYQIIPQPRAIVLFGSYRHGVDTEESDLDIAVEVLGNEEFRIRKIVAIEQLGYRKNIPVNIHIFSRNKIDINLFSNIANGIVLDGFLEVRP